MEEGTWPYQPSEQVTLGRAIESFNQARFFDAHELFEDLWRLSPEAEKLFWQGLTQVCVALHHESRGNRTGAASVLNRAIRNLSGCPEHFAGVQWGPLRDSLEGWSQAFEKGTLAPSLPVLMIANVAERR
ncbi:MAG: hypothetical protein NVS1B11_29480 [Terriglobales bacterium]